MEIDWFELWRELAAVNIVRAGNRERAGRYEISVRHKAVERPDPLLDFVLQNIDERSKVLDVGAGNGRWTIPLARMAGSVTAVEPSGAMVGVLGENIAAAKLKNIKIVQAPWEDAVVGPHDIIVSAHAIYGSPDFAACTRKIERHAGRGCYLALRLPPHNGIIGELSLAIYGHRHDSPNAIIASNALYSMGIYANVLVEDGIRRWTDSTFDRAFARAKRHLRLESSAAYDELIRETLARRLTCRDGVYVWPDGMRSALLWWRPSPVSE